MKKTAMQQMIEWIYSVRFVSQKDYLDTKAKATELLETERHDLQDAMNHGLDNHVPKSGLGYRQIEFNKYYNETFK